MSNAEVPANRREFSRAITHPRVRLSSPGGGEEWTATILDVSLRGVMVEGECAVDPGVEVSIQIILGEGHGDFVIDAKGTIVRKTSEGTAIEITELEDPESFEHLRNLVLYNSTTPAPVEAEFRRHVGISREGAGSD